MFRWRSLSHAMSIEGPEIASSSARTPSGIHIPRPSTVATMLEKNVAIPPTATPIAAMVPMSIFFGGRRRRAGARGGGGGGGAAGVSSLGASVIVLATAEVWSFLSASASAAAARLASCSSMRRMKRL